MQPKTKVVANIETFEVGVAISFYALQQIGYKNEEIGILAVAVEAVAQIAQGLGAINKTCELMILGYAVCGDVVAEAFRLQGCYKSAVVGRIKIGHPDGTYQAAIYDGNFPPGFVIYLPAAWDKGPFQRLPGLARFGRFFDKAIKCSGLNSGAGKSILLGRQPGAEKTNKQE